MPLLVKHDKQTMTSFLSICLWTLYITLSQFFITQRPAADITRGEGGKVPLPSCYRVSKFLAKVVELRLNTRFFKKKTIFCLSPNFLGSFLLMKDKYNRPIFDNYSTNSKILGKFSTSVPPLNFAKKPPLSATTLAQMFFIPMNNTEAKHTAVVTSWRSAPSRR